MIDRTKTAAYALCQITGHTWLANFGTGEQWCTHCGVRGYCVLCLAPLPHAVATYCQRHRREQEARDQQRQQQQKASRKEETHERPYRPDITGGAPLSRS